MQLKSFMQDTVSMQKGSVKIPIKGMIETYRERYEELAAVKKFSHIAYKTLPGGRHIVHVKVPSKTLNRFFYDVLLEFEPTPGATTFEDCNIRIFSNSPSFVYSYAYVFYHLDPDGDSTDKERKRAGVRRPGMLIDKLVRKIPSGRLLMPGTEKKLGEKVIDNAPVIRNPYGLPLFDSSIYMAIFYLNDTATLADVLSTRNVKSENLIFMAIPDFDILMDQRARIAVKEKSARDVKRRADEASIKKTETAVKESNRYKTSAHLIKPKAAMKPASIHSPKKPVSITKKRS